MNSVQTIARNQLVGNLASLRESYGSDVKLYDLPDAEFDDSASPVALALAKLGFIAGARVTANENRLWSLSVAEFCEWALDVFEPASE